MIWVIHNQNIDLTCAGYRYRQQTVGENIESSASDRKTDNFLAPWFGFRDNNCSFTASLQIGKLKAQTILSKK